MIHHRLLAVDAPSRSERRPIRAVLALLAVGGVCQALAAAPQFVPGGLSGGVTTPVGGAPFVEAWVDPVVATMPGAFTPSVGCPDAPFATIQAAISQLAATPGVGPQTPGLVHVMPGIYGLASVGGNGEAFPIRMAENVSVQGLAARACVIRGDQTQTPFLPFLPVIPFGSRATAEVLVDFSGCTNAAYVEFVDGVTFQGGAVQVYAEARSMDVHGRISNCVFDMLSGSDVNLIGPEFGVLMVHVFQPDVVEVPDPNGTDPSDPHEPGGGGGHGGGGGRPGEPMGSYRDVQLQIINNTFAQGWEPNAAQTITATTTSVAICDVADTLMNDQLFPSLPPDRFQALRGVGNPNIQNNLIRCLDPLPLQRTALMGIDATDTSVVIATPPPGAGAPTDAFHPALAVSANLLYNSLIVQPNIGPVTPPVPGVVPVPAVIPNRVAGGADPGFVGEMVGQLLGSSFAYARDWRLLWASSLFDAGFAPLNGLLGATNGTTHVENPFGITNVHPVFDFDGEGYGNVRIQIARPDIGFDELDQMTACGAYVNDSLTDPITIVGAGCAFASPPTIGVPPVVTGVNPATPPLALFPLPGTVSIGQVSTPHPYFVNGLTFPGLCGTTSVATALSSPSGSLVNPQFIGQPALPFPMSAGTLYVDLGGPPVTDPQATLTTLPAVVPGLPIGSIPITLRGVFTPVNDPVGAFPIFAATLQPAGVLAGGVLAPFLCVTTVEQGYWTPLLSPPLGAPLLTNMQTTVR